MKKLFRQVFYELRTQPVIGWVTITGTAVSIFLIIVIVMMQQVSVMNFAPESHRDRMLYGMFFHYESTGEGRNNSSANLGYTTARELYHGLEGVEAECYMESYPANPDLKGTTGEQFSGKVRSTDAGFWRIFDHKLLSGRFFTDDEGTSNAPIAVISESTARRLFGTADAVGRRFELDHSFYDVIGVVENTSPLASFGTADVYIPINTELSYGDEFGPFCAILLVKPGVDFQSVRNQVKARYAGFETSLASRELRPVYHEAPFTQEVVASGFSASNLSPDIESGRRMRYVLYAVLLLVPAINLSSMLHSRLRRRVNEIGIRRAFGCTRRQIISQIISENFLVTLIGGIIGVAAGVCFGLFYDGLITDVRGEAVKPALGMLLNFQTIGIALILCFVLNIISASVPAWLASRLNPVEAINSK